MAYAERLVKSWRSCWKGPDGKVHKQSGFPTKKAALDYGHEQEAEGRRRGARATVRSQMTLEEWALDWYAALDLEPSSTARYLSYLQNHVIPRWGDWSLRDLQDADAEVARWVKELRQAGYAHTTVSGIKWMLHTLCDDAVDQGHMSRNPAVTKRRRGRVAAKRKIKLEDRESKVVVDPLTALLIAERCAVLTGRGDEFTLIVTMFYTGARWGEATGIERSHISPRLHIRSQLTPHGSALQYRGPKDGSVRHIDLPPFLAELMQRQAKQVAHPEVEGEWCPCGQGEPEKYRHTPGIHLFAGIKGQPHWKRSNFGDRFFSAAARGRHYPGQAQERPVYVEPREDGTFGMLDRATRYYARPDLAVACWAPLAPGMVTHSLRHSHKTLLEELGVPAPLMNERMGHSDSSVQARYSHPTLQMRRHMTEALQGRWEESLRDRAAMDPRSPVELVDGLLEPYREGDSRSAPDSVGYPESPVRGIVA